MTATMTGPGIGEALAGSTGGAPTPGYPASASGADHFAMMQPQNLLLQTKVHLGLIRDTQPPTDHIGLQFAPFLSVESDDVVFDFVRGIGEGLAPARAEDAEARLITRDDFYSGRGGASVIDWSHKNHYRVSDVTRHRDLLKVVDTMVAQDALPLTVKSMVSGFQGRITRDALSRRRMLDNRIEWLIAKAIGEGKIFYNDGSIMIDVSFFRPADQHDQLPASGVYTGEDHDPINDLLKAKRVVYSRKGVELDRAICSSDYLNSFYLSKKFRILAGLGVNALDASDMPYALPGWGPKAAIDIVARETGIQFIVADNVLRTAGAKVGNEVQFTNTRYYERDRVILLPSEAQLAAYDNTEIGFGKTLTSPHIAANWQTGFYAWEREFGMDPWGVSMGTGIKAFPVFPHMDLTYSMKVTLPPSL